MSKVFYPILLTVFLILNLYLNNVDEVPLKDVWLPLGVSLIGIGLVWTIFRYILKNKDKAGIVVLVVTILLFNYGWIKTRWPTIDIVGEMGSTALLLLLMLLVVLGITWLVRRKRNLGWITRYFNIVGIILVGILIIQAYPAISNIKEFIEIEPVDIGRELSKDIYYIILDEYARQDTLDEYFGYDNSWFIEGLEDRGFHINSESKANYDWTVLSLSSTLNMRYHVEESKEFLPYEHIANSSVASTLKSVGYEYIMVSNAPWRNSSKFGELRSYKAFSLPISNFSDYLILHTPLKPISLLFNLQAEKVLYTFRETSKIPNIEERTFTFTYIQCPHPPFVFDKDGNKVTREPSKEAYLEQLIFIGKKTLDLVDTLLPSDPIIILQSDTGPGPYIGLEGNEYEKERMKILNAYYGFSGMYKGITPVNTFRTLFGIELLEDKSYLGWLEE